ncbi:MAG: hypothetical protein L3J22_05635 [Xanthomonadales bacterium]|nr:hypothetical protein [Xanthomonadales bacterium]
MDIIQQVINALKDGATADKLQALSLQLRKRSYELRTRQTEISPDGLERREIAQSGDISALQKLNAECLELVAQIDGIEGIQGRLATALMVAKAKEAADTMNDKCKALEAYLDAETAAKQALNKARCDTDGQLGAMTQARMDINTCANTCGTRFEAPAADAGLLGRYIEVRGIHPEPGAGWGRNIHTVERAADSMGLTPPRASEAA